MRIRVLPLALFLALVFPCTAAAQDRESPLGRWIDVQQAQLTLFYHYAETNADQVTHNQLRYKELFRGRFKFDPEGRLTLTAGVSTGSTFTNSLNDTGIGRGDLKTNLRLRQLYVAAKPVSWMELQAGGIYLERGESTEITSYDNDGYIVGYRLSMKRPKSLLFDHVSVTYGYLGDVDRPNLNKRFHRLCDSNYHQVLVGKKLGKRASLTVDYTFQSGAETLREAAVVKTPELGVVDSIRVEAYQRLDVNRAAGFAAQGEKALLGKRLTVGAGVAHVDDRYGGLNGDRYGTGSRVFGSASYALTSDLTVNAFVGRSVGRGLPTANGTRADFYVTYNVLGALRRAGLF